MSVSLDIVNAAIGSARRELEYTFSKRDTIAYALGIGAPSNWLDQDELKFVYEQHDNFCALPSMGVIYAGALIDEIVAGDIAGIRFNPMMVVHGEQALEIKQKLPVEGTILCKPIIRDIYDKGSGMLVITEVACFNAAGEEIAVSTTSTFIRGLGNFGGERGSSEKVTVPERAPDIVQEHKTLETQALLYRLSGDINPLHADPKMAAIGNFDTPILQGLATFGFATRAIVKHFCGNDPASLKSIQVRFSREVYPGDTLVTEMWDTGDGIVFQMKVKERDVVVLSQSKATLF